MLNPEFSARFVKLAIIAATPYEISSVMTVFTRAHPSPKVIIIGLDAGWCIAGEHYPHLTPRPFPALETLDQELSALPGSTRKIVFFVPYNRHLLVARDRDGAAVWSECKRRTAGMANAIPNLVVTDFMRPGPITNRDDYYWDPLHYLVGVANRLAIDLSQAANGDPSPD